MIDHTRTALRAKQSPLVVLPTGGGKTALIAELTRLAGITGNQVSVICHR